jgi:hypothetical protein
MTDDDLRPALLYLFGLWLSFENIATDVSVVVVGGQRGKQLCHQTAISTPERSAKELPLVPHLW